MVAVKGYYDGSAVQLLENIQAAPNQKVIVTVMDEFMDSEPVPTRSLRGILSAYADPRLAEQEEGAWEHAAAERLCAVRLSPDIRNSDCHL